MSDDVTISLPRGVVTRMYVENAAILESVKGRATEADYTDERIIDAAFSAALQQGVCPTCHDASVKCKPDCPDTCPCSGKLCETCGGSGKVWHNNPHDIEIPPDQWFDPCPTCHDDHDPDEPHFDPTQTEPGPTTCQGGEAAAVTTEQRGDGRWAVMFDGVECVYADPQDAFNTEKLLELFADKMRVATRVPDEPRPVDEGAVVAKLATRDFPCRVIYQLPDVATCLDKQAHAADPANRYSDEWRAKVLDDAYLCTNCFVRKAISLAASPSTDEQEGPQ